MEEASGALSAAVAEARQLHDGEPASYIPELALVDLERTSAAIQMVNGGCSAAGDASEHRFTLQSVAKLVLLAGLLEERGPEEVFSVVGAEPSGAAFSSMARLETHGPLPANPLVNSGAIALCGLLEGHVEDSLAWLDRWMHLLCGAFLPVNARVLASERRTGHKNRAIAHLLRSRGVLTRDPDEVLESYFALCSYVAGVEEAARLAAVLAGGGVLPGGGGRVLSQDAAAAVVSLMATCGMYDESGAHLLSCGLPAKSGVSGVVLAVAPGRGGRAAASPRINRSGTSVRGRHIIRSLAARLGWHFALPEPT